MPSHAMNIINLKKGGSPEPPEPPSAYALVRYVINNLLHLVIVKYGDISLVLCISTRLRLVTILSLLVKYLVILHADPCNKSYIYNNTRKMVPIMGRASS